MASVIEVGQDTFKERVVDSEKPVVVDFWAEWCGPCKKLSPIIEEIAGERDDVTFAKVNVDDQRTLAAMFQVFSIPTVVIFSGGKKVEEFSGLRPKDELNAIIDRSV